MIASSNVTKNPHCNFCDEGGNSYLKDDALCPCVTVSRLPRTSTPADILSTGEAQPRLPGDVGHVRDQEHEQPPVADLPADTFMLTPPEASEPRDLDLFRQMAATPEARS